MLFFNEQQVRSAANVAQVVSALREAFAHDFRSTLHMPLRTHVDLGTSVLLLMPCHDSYRHIAGVKIVTVSQRSGVNATYALLDPDTGKTVAVIEADYLTDLRTAATSAVATDLMARPDSQTLGIFGTGRQAKIHLSVLPHIRSFRQFLVCGSGRSDLAGFCSSMKREHGIEVTPVDAKTCARESDVLCTCTTAREPLFDGRLLRLGTHLNLIGAFQPHAREVDDEAVRRSRVVVDTYEGALAEAGDLLIPLSTGLVARDHICADLHEIASGKKRGRTGTEEITLFKSVGCALEDLVVANLLCKEMTAQRSFPE
jgi:ornithine cyclodeaminase/alanine dehydrogenase-like protein (mu-crystallin family)